MNIQFKIEGLDKLNNTLKNMEKQVRYAAAKACTQTAQKVKQELTEEMKRVFHQPTPFTLKSIYVLPATKENLTAEVGVKWDAVKYLRPQIEGGGREVKRSEHWLKSFYVPGQAIKRNVYGNVSPGKISQILAGTFTSPDATQWITKRSRLRKKKTARPFYFIKRDTFGLHPGVWQRYGRRKIKPMLMFIENPQYKKRFDFYEVGVRTAEREFKRIFDASLADAIRTAR
jgi:hypothetical protein